MAIKWIKKKGKTFWPSDAMKKRAWVSDEKIYKEAEKNPIKFWSRLAAEGISWFKKWKTAYISKPPYFKWFVGGMLNASYNCLDRHVETWRKNKAVIIWEPEPTNESPRILTYYQLYREVNKFANVLKDLGVKKGDRVSIYLPMIPEVQIAMLACARIGAIHSVVFSAFSSEALKTRIIDAEAKVLITADGYYRRGQVVNLKASADEAVNGTGIEKMIVVKRAGNEVNMVEGRDFWWHELMKKAKSYCKPEAMDAEDILFILYTSGCCHKDTLVQLEDGRIKKISDLVEKGGSNIINFDLNKLVQGADRITERFKYYEPSSLLKIQTPLSTINVTPNHRIFVLENGEVVEKKAEQLKEGDHILQVVKIDVKGQKQKLPTVTVEYKEKKCSVSPTNKPKIPMCLTPGFSQILGYCTGDGSLKSAQIDATDKDKHNLLFYKSLIEKELGVRCFIKKYDRQRLVISSTFLARYLKSVFPEVFANSHQRNIPEMVQASKNDCVAAFIRGLFDAEGCVTGGIVKVTSQSKELIQTLQMLLLRFGIVANYFEEKRVTHFRERRYKILVYGLKISDRISLRQFRDEIGFSSVRKVKKLNNLLQKLQNKKIASMIHQIPINSLMRTLRKTIMLPKKECRKINIDSYIYTARKTKTIGLSKIGKYVKQKIGLIRGLDLSKREGIKTAIALFKVSQKDLANVSGKSINTVHQYMHRKIPKVPDGALEKFYSSILPYLTELKKEKLKILRQILKKIKKLENLKNAGFFEVKKIKRIKNNSKFVYDLTALMYHNYIANSFVVHNSTGKPKGIFNATGGYLTQAYWTAKWDFELHDDDVFWCTSDIGWVTGHTYACYGPLLNGTTMLIYEGAPDWPQPDRWWEIIEKYGVTVFYTAPTAIRMFITLGEEWVKKHDLSSLRLLASVGEPIDEDAWMWYFNVIGGGRCPIIDTWWQTETGGTLINSLPGIGPFVPTFACRSFPGTRHAVLDEKGRPVKPFEKGSLVQLPPFAPGMLRGIWKNPQKYLETYWSKYGKKIYYTSDAALVDRKGMIRIVGREDDVIKVAGHRIATGEIENALNLHEKVTESAVIGMSHKIKGEVPLAFVILKSGITPSQMLVEELIQQVRKVIGPIAKPEKIIFVEDLPKTRSGKIMRRILKSLLTKQPVGDISTLANPECVEKIKKLITELNLHSF